MRKFLALVQVLGLLVQTLAPVLVTASTLGNITYSDTEVIESEIPLEQTTVPESSNTDETVLTETLPESSPSEEVTSSSEHEEIVGEEKADVSSETEETIDETQKIDTVPTEDIPETLSKKTEKIGGSSSQFASARPEKVTSASKEAPHTEKQVPGEVIVKVRESQTSLGRTMQNTFQSLSALGGTVKEELPNGYLLVTLSPGTSTEQGIKALRKSGIIENAYPNYRYTLSEIATNDTERERLWGLDNGDDHDIDAPEAWTTSEGSGVIVAVIDTGVDYGHPDLAANMWDGTNCVDEFNAPLGGCVHGYDFEGYDLEPLPTWSTHGTHVAGTIAAVGNNSTGVIGVAPLAKIMAINTDLTTASIIKSIAFAKYNGAQIINASWGGSYFDYPMYDAIADFPGLFVAAAGNSSSDNDNEGHHYPSDYDLPNIVSVASTDIADELSYFSSYGAISVDLGAPGENIYSTVMHGVTQFIEYFSDHLQSLIIPALPVGFTPQGNWVSGYDPMISGEVVIFADVQKYPYTANATHTLTSPTIDLSGTSEPTMSFYTGCDTPYSSTEWQDYMSLEWSGDGVTFEPAYNPFPVLGERLPLYWDEASLDFDTDADGFAARFIWGLEIPESLQTDHFQFRFTWHTNATDNDHGGCFVDDFSVGSYDSLDYSYEYLSGTSMAAPHVAGTAALLIAHDQEKTIADIKNALMYGGDTISALSGKTVSGKRLNAEGALQFLDTGGGSESPFSPLDTVSAFGTTIVLRFPSLLQTDSVPDTTDFVVTRDGTPVGIESIELERYTDAPSHSILTLTLDTSLSAEDDIQISYTRGTHPLQYSRANIISDFVTGVAFITHTFCLTVTDVSASECDGLLALYESTDGENWINHTGWGEDSTVCSWYGVSCQDEHVTEVSLNTQGLDGAIPAGFGNLIFLKHLYLARNNISGFPSEISNLTQLEDLHLGSASMTSVPVEIGNITNLNWLAISESPITSLPAELSNLTNLKYLHLNNNQFTSIPDVIFEMTALESLIMDYNAITSIPSDIGNLSHLSYLSLNSNSISSIAAEIATLPLSIISLDNNHINTFPIALLGLQNLSSLVLSSNQLTTLPDDISDIPLTQLMLEQNSFTTFPTSVSGITSLQRLDLSNNFITSVPEAISGLSELRQLFLQYNSITSLPPQIGSLSQLRTLDVGINQLQTLPAEIGNLTNLRSLRLYNNHISTLPAQITALNLVNFGFAGDYDLVTSINCLSALTLDPAIVTWLNVQDSDWESQQTGGCVTGVTSSFANGNYKTGDIISGEVTFRGNVDVESPEFMSGEVGIGNGPRLTLETGATDAIAQYVSGSGTTTLHFEYTVGENDNSLDLDYVSTSSLTLNGGALTVQGNPVLLTLPAPGAAGSLGANKNITINVRNLNTGSPQTPVTSSTTPVNVVVTEGTINPSLNVSSLITGGTGTLPQITITANNTSNTIVSIPAYTTITSSDPLWDGIIKTPTVSPVTLPTVSGQTSTLGLALELGDVDSSLTFDKAVRILIPNQASKRAGYTRSGSSFTEITTVCASDDQTIMNSLPAAGDCKMDIGSDLVIWTKHFTTFATYTQTAIPSSGGGGGGGGGGSFSGFTKTKTKTPKNIDLNVFLVTTLGQKNDTPASRRATVAVGYFMFGGTLSTDYVCKNKYIDVIGSEIPSNTCQIAEKAQDAGLISPTNTKFKPLNTVSRIEAYSILMKSVCVHPITTADNWQTEVIKQAMKVGFTVRTLDTFEPNRPLTTSEVYAIAGQMDTYKKAHPESCTTK